MGQNRNPVSRLERMLSSIVEGTFGRMFRTGLQPVELSRRLENAMDNNIVLTNNRRVAPNAYILTVSTADYTRFQQFMQTLIKQLQDRVIVVARQRGYVLTTRPVVVVQPDARMGKGDLDATAHLFDNTQLNNFAASYTQAPDGSTQSSIAMGPNAAPPDYTQVIAPQPNKATPAPAVGTAVMPYAAMVLRTPQGPGQTYPVNRDVIHIGRHTTNDIVVNDKRISRYHAEIRFEHGQFVIYDLGSLNGISVNRTRTPQATLHNGDLVDVGSYSFVFERR